MGLVNYAYVSFGGLLPMSRPVIDEEMPVHDWLRNHYGEDKHLLHEVANPCALHGSGVFEDYIAVVEQTQALFTQRRERFSFLPKRDQLRPRKFGRLGPSTPLQTAVPALLQLCECDVRDRSQSADAVINGIWAALQRPFLCRTMASVIESHGSSGHDCNPSALPAGARSWALRSTTAGIRRPSLRTAHHGHV